MRVVVFSVGKAAVRMIKGNVLLKGLYLADRLTNTVSVLHR